MKLEIINESHSEVFDALVDGVRSFNREHLGPETSKPLATVARNNEGEIIGGVSGRTIYNNFLIEVVWVHSSARGTGLGKQLMEMALEQAKQRQCQCAQVDTLDFQAPVFYQKLGFEIAGEISGYGDGPARFFLAKVL
ncbi:GNAT family N-acetyltransferase [Paraferrimonas sedimenticola]|uniref:N-acetyltransferase GCN5 n=1 Tax=Paraferrimonas sedimenticola TaxID=375674 RepID=A0AA37W185_9GAMM|nr:GNAT family N-acetyltransferase [Paraferrimonas sedimenticola]GLP96628.1 N-acetyltransferase GCN5 [Paraferrimonas sedimenticola]